jgi:amino acid transporter
MVHTAQPGTQLRRTLTAPKIVFLVVAAAAPLTAMVGTVPLAMGIGNGAGVPATFAFAGLTLLCFSVGYAAMSHHVVSTGGFYTYIGRGLGRPAAVGGGLVALIAYNAATIGLVGAFGYFTNLVAGEHGLHLPWEVWVAIAVAVVAFLGYREIDVSAKLLSVLMICEIAILAILDVAILVQKGVHAAPATSFSAHTVFSPGLGVALMFAFMSFIGFESAALYGEETANPRRAVPIATYASVVLIAVYYAVTSWLAVGGIGPDRVTDVANAQLGDLFFGLSDQYLNGAATTVMQVLMCTSLFAAVLSLHSATNRYTYVLGREGVLPRWLGRAHATHGSPHRASLVQTAITVAVCALFALAGLDPYTNLATSMLGLGTLGIVVLQAAAALSVLGFFARRTDRHWWRTILAPLLGLAGLLYAAVLLVRKFPLVTGTDSAVVNALPWVMGLVALAGIGYGLWLRRNRPERYAALAAEEPERVEHPDADADADAGVAPAPVGAGALADRPAAP